MPIEKFNDITQAIKCLQEWKLILGLNDWIVKVKLVEPHEFELDDVDGECEYVAMHKCATIRIMKPEYYGNRILKYCAERILVHELLHCKFALLDTDNVGFNRLMHQTHEDITKALICVKYGIDNEWFSNVSYDEFIEKASSLG